jgi:hypothetical protein
MIKEAHFTDKNCSSTGFSEEEYAGFGILNKDSKNMFT